MESIKAKITDKSVKELSGYVSRINDTDLSGFHVQTSQAKGVHRYYYYYRLKGGRGAKQRYLKLGDTTTMNASKAREAAVKAAGRVASGEDVFETLRLEAEKIKQKAIEKNEKDNAPSVNKLLDEFESFVKRTRKEPEEVIRMFYKDVRPSIGDIKLRDIDGKTVKRLCLDKIKNGEPIKNAPADTTKRTRPAPNQALKTQRLLKQVFDYGVSEQWLDSNPLEAAKSKFSGAESEERDRFLNADEIHYFFNWLKASTASLQVKSCFRLLLLTGCRSKEMTLSEWSHINEDKREWFFPKANRKGRKGETRDHTVPLTNAMLEELSILKAALTDLNSHYIFPSTSGQIGIKPIDRAACAKFLKRRFDNDELNIEPFVPHDFRRTFSTLMADREHDPFILEQCIGHVLPTEIMRTYQISSFWNKRVETMEAWSALVLDVWSDQTNG